MKKTLLLLGVLFLYGNANLLKAQCYGYVKYDQSSNGNGNSTFNITTAHSNELILIAYDGWPGPGNGPITVDGNSATHINTSHVSNSGTTEVYCYSAPAAGTHTIVCNESGYLSGFYQLNFAAAFYDSATCTPLSCASLVTTETAAGAGTTNSNTLTTTTPNELIFSTAEFNTGIFNTYSIADTGAKVTETYHESDGLDANIGYTDAPTVGTYTVSTSDPNACCGGTTIMVAMIPGTCSSAFSVTNTVVQPSCRGNDGQITVTTIGGVSPFTYTWSPNVSTTNVATGLSSGVYVITILSPGDSCSSLVDSVVLVGPSVSMSSTDTKCVPSNTGTASVNISNGKPPFTYTWSNGQTRQTATGLTSGEYTVTVEDHTGCIFTDSVSVSTYPAPTITTTPATADTVCYDVGGTISGNGGVSYTWLPLSGLSCYNCVSPVASPSVSTIYTVTGTDSNGCTNTATILIRVDPLPVPIVRGADTICIGNSTTLTASGGVSYVWSPGGATTSSYTVRPPVTKTYTLQATGANGCSKDTTVTVTVVPIPRAKITASKDSVCSGDSLTLEASGGTTYRWSPGNSTNLTLHLNPLSTVTYTLVAYGGTCTDSATITLNILKPISGTISITKDSICPHQCTTITMDGTGGPVIYRWSTGATTSSITVCDSVTTTYTGTVYGRCDSMNFFKTVYVIPLPQPAVSGTYTSLCAGMKDTLTVTSSVNPTTYLWSTGQRGTSIVTNDINTNTTIYVTAYNSLGCSVVDTFHISVTPYPTATLTYNTECGNTETLVSVVAGGTGPFTYLWNTGGTNDTIEVNIQDTGTFRVIVSNGCSIAKEITVTQDIPTLSACCSTTILLGEDTIIEAGGANIVKYQWSPSDGLNCTTCSVVTASPTVTTTYTVTGTDTAGCPIERTVTIVVETPCFDFIVPNVFTPTEKGLSGLDNVFYIQTKNIKIWSLIIFDRWGHEVFKSTNPLDFWAGTNESGGNAPEGVYYYVIDATCINAEYKKEGFIQLIR